jgi:hypothetical protein
MKRVPLLRRTPLFGLLWTIGILASTAPSRAADDPGGIDFFERKIRPVLVKECYACHAEGAKAIKAGLRVDSRDGLREGGDSGPAVTPGKPDESLLLDALRHDGIEMPPTGRLRSRSSPTSSAG